MRHESELSESDTVDMRAPRAAGSPAPAGWAELYVQKERWVADRWKVMFRVNEFEVYCIGAECTNPDCAERLRADFHKALTALGVKLPNDMLTVSGGPGEDHDN